MGSKQILSKSSPQIPKLPEETSKVQPSPSPEEEITIAGQSIPVGATTVQSSKGSTPTQIIKGIEKATQEGVFPEPPQVKEDHQNE